MNLVIVEFFLMFDFLGSFYVNARIYLHFHFLNEFLSKLVKMAFEIIKKHTLYVYVKRNVCTYFWTLEQFWISWENMWSISSFFFLYCNRINMQYLHWRMQKKVYLKFKFVQGQDRGHLKADKATVLFTIRHTGYIYTYTGISISNLIRTNVKVLYSTPPPLFLLWKYWYPMHWNTSNLCLNWENM